MKDKQKYIEKMYRNVAKSFKGFKKKEIKIKYYHAWELIAGYAPLNAKETKKEPLIGIGDCFFDCTNEEQKGIIAHEIGHHKTMKNWTIQRTKRHHKWLQMYKQNTFPYFKPHWKQRLRQLFILNEMAADNKAAETKYGKNLLQYYKDNLHPSYKPKLTFVKNLEEKLREKE